MKAKFELHHVTGWAQKLFDLFRYVVLTLVICGAFLALYAPTRSVLDRFKLLDEKTLSTVLALAIGFNIAALNSVATSSKKSSDKLDKLMESKSTLIIGGIGNVYERLRIALEDQCQKEGPRSSLEVLGLALYSTWSHLEPWIRNDRDRIHDINVTLYCLDPQFIRDHSQWIPSEWAVKAQSAIDDITKFKNENAKLLRSRSVKIDLYIHHNFPSMHGFRVDKREIFVCFSRWAGEASTRMLDYGTGFYELFPAADGSERAEEYRKLFSNWLEEAKIRSRAV